MNNFLKGFKLMQLIIEYSDKALQQDATEQTCNQ